MRWFLGITAVALAVTGSASAELVARVPDGMIAVAPTGTPLVAFVRGQQLVVAQRTGRDRWTQQPVRVARGSRLAAFKAGRAGPVAVVIGPGERSVSVLRRQGTRWLTTRLSGSLGADVSVGWPGLALAASGLPIVAYTQWHSRSLNSQLILAKVDARGGPHTQRVTAGGWPKSYTPPPAAPVVVRNGSVHVVETYGVGGAVGTIEWIPRNRTWIGLYLSAGRGGFPIGPMFAAIGRGSVVYAAWTEEFPGSLYGGFPVTLATHGREITEDIVSERGVTTGLAMTRDGPALAANEWVAADTWSFSVTEPEAVWAGTVTGRGGSELDGRLAGLAAVPGSGAQDLLLARPDGLSWFRSRGSLPVHVTLDAEQRADGSIALSGHVQGAHGGHVMIYRERSSTSRETAGTARIGAGGTFTLVDTARTRPTFYRAVYVDPATGIPYAKLLRDPIG
ncbi:MAG: hypothetical protein ACTHNB_07280 [Gaiellaceae bacterium]